MSLFIKICGVRTMADVAAAAVAGADAVGIVMTSSIRQVDHQRAAKLREATPDGLVTVGVFYHPTADAIRRARDEVGFDLIQGETESLRGIDDIVSLPVVHDQEGLARAVEEAFAVTTSGRVLVEGRGRGGHGRKPDWSRVHQIERLEDVILAGGLTPSNVSTAIESIHPGGVDVSSGVESSPGLKDPALITRFVEAARTAGKKVAS
jgi:phosphoribosylanthranilate isomerase